MLKIYLNIAVPFLFLLISTAKRVNCQPRYADQFVVGQAIFGTPFLVLSLTRVSSAVLNRAAQSPEMLPNFLAAQVTRESDHLSTGRLCASSELRHPVLTYTCRSAPSSSP